MMPHETPQFYVEPYPLDDPARVAVMERGKPDPERLVAVLTDRVMAYEIAHLLNRARGLA